MKADLFRNFYAYHFSLNRRIWDECIVPLTDEQFTRKVDYSVGSARNHVVHMMNIDDRWFSGLRGEPVPDFVNFDDSPDRAEIRKQWDVLEARMQSFLNELRDEDLTSQPFIADKDTTQLWQILLHVANHGTDHRAQLLRIVNELGMKTFVQDYADYIERHTQSISNFDGRNADMFRDYYEYDIACNRKLWDECIVPLTDEQFTRKVEYSVGSVRNHAVHLVNIDDRWFSGLRGEPVPGFVKLEDYSDRSEIRQMWDAVEAKMRAYLKDLRDEDLTSKPFMPIDGDTILLWQVLLHVANHGTDHRAQLLRILSEMGIKTFPQDYIMYVWEHPNPQQ